MSFNTLYAVNGVGKDAIAGAMRRRNPQLKVTSETRMLMCLLGIANNISADSIICREQYMQLESTPQSVIVEAELGGKMQELVGNVATSSSVTLNLSHLVYATYLGGDITYLQKPKALWYIQANKSLVQLTAPAEIILARRTADAPIRQRITISTDEINHHQNLCDQEWQRINNLAVVTTAMALVANIDLDTAVKQVEEVIYK